MLYTLVKVDGKPNKRKARWSMMRKNFIRVRDELDARVGSEGGAPWPLRVVGMITWNPDRGRAMVDRCIGAAKLKGGDVDHLRWFFGLGAKPPVEVTHKLWDNAVDYILNRCPDGDIPVRWLIESIHSGRLQTHQIVEMRGVGKKKFETFLWSLGIGP